MSKNVKLYNCIMLILYGAALVTCFICDFALNGSLTWSYMVLVSLLISISITNLPCFVQKHKSTVSAIAVTCFTYLLLYVCCEYVNGNWLFSFAYPIATYSFIFAWILYFVFRSKKINWGFKASLTFLLSAIFSITCNPLIATLSGEEMKFMDLFVYNSGLVNYAANGIIFVCLIVVAVISAVIGVILQKRN